MQKLKLTDIDFERSIQVRAKIHAATVAEYAEHIQSNKPPLPPITVFGPDSRGKYYLSEGWHRVAAHRKARRDAVQASIREGGWKEALEHALFSNGMHGVRRTNADKRHAVQLALKHWPIWNDVMIANKCGVSDRYVRGIRNSARPRNGSGVLGSRVITRKDGTTMTLPPVPACPPPLSSPPQSTPVQDVGPRIGPPVQPLEDRPEPLPADGLGRTVPPDQVGLWERRHQVQNLLTAVSRIRSELKKAQDDRDPLWSGNGQGQSPINFSSALAHLNQAYSDIKAALPFCVCPMCQGTGCRACSGLGLMSEYRYDTIVPASYKKADKEVGR